MSGNLNLIITDLMANELTIEVGHSLTAEVKFEVQKLIFSVPDLCIIKKFLSEAIYVLRPRMENLVVKKIPHEIKVGHVTLNWAELKIIPFIDHSVHMPVENLMWSRRYIANCIVEMMLNKKRVTALV